MSAFQTCVNEGQARALRAALCAGGGRAAGLLGRTAAEGFLATLPSVLLHHTACTTGAGSANPGFGEQRDILYIQYFAMPTVIVPSRILNCAEFSTGLYANSESRAWNNAPFPYCFLEPALSD